MKRYIYIWLCLAVVGCAGVGTGPSGRYEPAGPVVLEIEGATHQEIWKATMMTLVGMGFTIREKDYEAGVVQTGFVRAPNASMMGGPEEGAITIIYNEVGGGLFRYVVRGRYQRYSITFERMISMPSDGTIENAYTETFSHAVNFNIRRVQ